MEHEVSNQSYDSHQRILFRLQKDEDDYPPHEWESLWAIKLTSGQFQIDNIPFFVRGISLEDIIVAEYKDEEKEWHFQHIAQRSQNSVMRIIVFDPTEVLAVREELESLGCTTESMKRLLDINIPASVSIGDIDNFLQPGKVQGRLECEDASIRH